MGRKVQIFRTLAWWTILASGWAALPSSAQASRGVELVRIVDGSGHEVGLYRASSALVIGIVDYTAGWPDLPGVESDVEAVSRVLEKHGFEVRREMNLGLRDLERVIREFIAEKGQEPDARVLIYFAGHGHSLAQSFGGKMGYVVPADAPRPDRNRVGFRAGALPMDQVEVYAKTIQSKHALFLFDSCFSGSIFALERAVPEHISSKTALPVRQFITSGSAEEKVPDESVFRRELVAALEGEGDTNGDGYVTAAELGEHLYEKVVNYSDGTQHPQYGKIRHRQLDKGDFVFEVPAPAIPPAPVVTAPPETSFSLEDLESQADRIEAARKAWDENLAEMKTAFERVENYESRGVEASYKEEAWRRFTREFREDNPYSEDDDEMRNHAAERLASWRRIAMQAPSEPPPSPPAPAPPPLTSPPHDPKPGDDWTEPANAMRLRYVPAGTFKMGSPKEEKGRDEDEKLHTVTLTRNFWMGETEVTQKQWQRLMRNNPSHFQTCGEECPVEKVSWWDALAFANRLSEEADLEECYALDCQGTPGNEDYTCKSQELRERCLGYRLPTEAEWERAARADTTGATYGGDLTLRGICDAPELEDIAWYCGNSDGATHPVGIKKANAWKLRDMLGNVWEWVEDAGLSTYADDELDPLSTRGPNRVSRGGSFADYERNCRAADRLAGSPGNRSLIVGFRLVRTAP